MSLLEVATSQSCPGPVLVPGRGAVDRSEQGKLQKLLNCVFGSLKRKAGEEVLLLLPPGLLFWRRGKGIEPMAFSLT